MSTTLSQYSTQSSTLSLRTKADTMLPSLSPQSMKRSLWGALTNNLKPYLIGAHALISIFGIIALSLMLGGCTSKLVPEIYVLKASANASDNAEVRLGYLGLCASMNGTRHCTAKANLAHIDDHIFTSNPLFPMGFQLLQHVFTVVFVGIATCSFGVAALAGPLHFFRIKQAGLFAQFTFGCCIGSTVAQLLAFIAFWWATHALKYSSNAEIAIQRGTWMVGLHIFMIVWPSFLAVPSCWQLVLKKFKRPRGKNDLGTA